MDWARGCAYCIIVHVCVNMTCSLALRVNKKELYMYMYIRFV